MWSVSDEMTPDKLKNSAYMLLRIIPGRDGRASDVIAEYISPECRSLMESMGFFKVPEGTSVKDLLLPLKVDWQKDLYDTAFLSKKIQRVIHYGHEGHWFEARLQQADESGRCVVLLRRTEDSPEVISAEESDEDENDSLSTVNLSLQCSKLMSSSMHIREAMESVFAILIRKLDADRCFLVETDTHTAWISFEKEKDNLEPLGIREKLPIRSFSGVVVPMTNDGVIMVRNLDENTALHMQEKRILQSMGISRYMAVPLYDSNHLIGFLAAINFDTDKANSSRNLFRLVAATVEAAVKTENMRRRLSFLSRHDPLTSLKNRQSLPEMLNTLERNGNCAGVVLADIDGLGKINREKGLHAGDACIVRCAEFLRMYFPTESIYRVDGGNFLVTLPNVDKTSFEALVDRVADSLSVNSQVPLNIRTKWCRDGKEVREAVENQLE